MTGLFRVREVARGADVAATVRGATSFRERLIGLMGRPALARDEGLWLPGVNSIHMLWMRFPIDAVFLAPGGLSHGRERWRVVEVRHDLPPWRGVVWWVRGASGVLELPAGSVGAAGLRPGDELEFEPS